MMLMTMVLMTMMLMTMRLMTMVMWIVTGKVISMNRNWLPHRLCRC